MAAFHEEKLIQAIKDTAGLFVQQESNRVSLITVTRVELSPKADKAVIFISIFPETKEGEAINFLNRNRGEFKEMFKERVRIGRIPFFTFEIDKGEKLRNKIDALV